MRKPVRAALLLSVLALSSTMLLASPAHAHDFEIYHECDSPFVYLHPDDTLDDTNYTKIKYTQFWKSETPGQGLWLGTQHITNYGGATVSYTLPNPTYQFVFGYTKMRNAGKAAVYLNDVYVTTIDMYAPVTDYNCALILHASVPAGKFTVKVLNQKNPLSGGTYVNIDYIHDRW